MRPCSRTTTRSAMRSADCASCSAIRIAVPLRWMRSRERPASRAAGGFGCELDPDRRMVARLVPPAMLAVDAGTAEPLGERGRQQQEVHAKARVAPECIGVDPEGVDAFVRMKAPCRVDPAL